MDRSLTSPEVAVWAEHNAPSVRGTSFQTIHVDDMLPEAFKRDPLATSLNAFAELSRAIRPIADECLALLVISVPPTLRMVRTPPPQIRTQWLMGSPPSLYLCGAAMWCAWGDEEEYRIRVHPQWFDDQDASVHYRVHRSPRAREHGWEFDRSFYLHAGSGWS